VFPFLASFEGLTRVLHLRLHPILSRSPSLTRGLDPDPRTVRKTRPYSLLINFSASVWPGIPRRSTYVRRRNPGEGVGNDAVSPLYFPPLEQRVQSRARERGDLLRVGSRLPGGGFLLRPQPAPPPSFHEVR